MLRPDAAPAPDSGQPPLDAAWQGRSLPRARFAATFLFVTLGLLVGGWLSRIPDVKHLIGVDDGRWGLLSTFGSIGSLTAMLVTAVLITRLGARRMTLIGVPVMLVAMPLLASSASVPHLIAGLLCWGLASGTIQAPINSAGIVVERAYGRPIMSGVHAGFSLGTLAGALLGALAVRAGLTPGMQLVLTSLLLGAAFVVVSRWLPPNERPLADRRERARRRAEELPDAEGVGAADGLAEVVDADGSAQVGTGSTGSSEIAGPRRRLPLQLVLLAAIGFCSALAEGTSSQWSGIYTRQVLHASPTTAALVYAAFAAAMSLGRIVGDRFVQRLGRARFLSTVPLICAVGLGAGLAVGTVPAAVVGFACAGLGLSCITPTVFGAAGNLPGMPAGRGISVMTVAAWPAFLTGPSVVGAISQAAGLRVGLGVVVAAAALAAVLATGLRKA